jgi:GNAT superfamily N-acetyltransferase
MSLYHVEAIETAEHIMQMQSLALQHHEELGKSFNEPFSIESVKRACEGIIADKQRMDANCWIVYKNGLPIGYLAATRFINFYNWCTNVRLEMLFVKKEARSAKAARLLITSLEEWGKAMNCKRVFLIVGHLEKTTYTDMIGRYFSSIGFRQDGTSHVKEISYA